MRPANDFAKVWENKAAENHPPGPALSHLGHSRLVIAVTAAFDNHYFDAQPAPRRKHCGRLLLICKKGSSTRKKPDLLGLWEDFQEEVESLASQFTSKCDNAGNVSSWPVESTNQTVLHGIATVGEDD